MTPAQIITRHWREITQLTGLLCAGFVITTLALVAVAGV
jgi:hypothetical protein